MNKCACCGKFRAWKDLYSQESDMVEGWCEQWYECWDCLSPFDQQRYAKAKQCADLNETKLSKPSNKNPDEKLPPGQSEEQN